MKRLLIATALSLLTATSAMAQTVYVVRHAEKRADQGSDPDLTAEGAARAAALAEALADAHPVLILVSPMKRTAQTAAPTAEAHDLGLTAVPFDDGVQGQVDATVARVRALPSDAVVLIVGHSNTVPLIARGLGYAEATDMPECEHDRLTVLHLMGDETHGEVRRYGAPSTCSE